MQIVCNWQVLQQINQKDFFFKTNLTINDIYMHHGLNTIGLELLGEA